MVHVGASAPEHYFCADSLIDMYKKQGKEVLIVLVTTSAALQTNAMLRYKEKLLLPSGVPEEAEVVHDRSGKLTADEVAARDRKGIMDSARDYYIMSLADVWRRITLQYICRRIDKKSFEGAHPFTSLRVWSGK